MSVKSKHCITSEISTLQFWDTSLVLLEVVNLDRWWGKRITWNNEHFQYFEAISDREITGQYHPLFVIALYMHAIERDERPDLIGFRTYL